MEGYKGIKDIMEVMLTEDGTHLRVALRSTQKRAREAGKPVALFFNEGIIILTPDTDLDQAYEQYRGIKQAESRGERVISLPGLVPDVGPPLPYEN